ncbi:homoserine dehydrogenase [Hymenobacter daecheongensis DSM 21074]|uniref:Homoserine dehydrogenase n=1 Tax=Hymenobacter daecheongensis DSM 21074 TaxID=1121955 RepID=A0A1M6LH62_9BACT|nr:homoserine dehydrogenase [Hymenobacter daecheongensis]SHJ70488.1 homoserine dehydrogenase [Hymenobacter daecheongensis DSM 21074]
MSSLSPINSGAAFARASLVPPAPLRVGLIGFGCVGQGFYDILWRLPGFGAEVRRIAVKNPAKPRTLPAERFTYHADELLADPELDVLVEVIDDAAEAFRLVSTALRQGRRVITANKAMVAQHLPELVALQHQHGGTLLYEAAVCGSIPIIRTLDAYFGQEPLRSVSGIFNGSSNYVLTRMGLDGTDYAPALAEAQAKGFAESDPTLDMAAFDPRSKAVILAAHAYGVLLAPEQVLNLGIENISATDIAYAGLEGQKIKVVAGLYLLPNGQLTVLVTPQFVGRESALYGVDEEFNGVIIEAEFAGPQFLRGRGAGGHPTGSAVLADLAALRGDFRYAYAKLRNAPLAYTTDLELEIYLRTTDELLLDQLGFTDITEEADEDGYIVGYVPLDALLQHRDALRQASAFVARTGNVRPAAAHSEEQPTVEEVSY